MEDKRLERVDSPDQLDQYIKLANPGVWTILTAIVVLLAGFCIWGIFGRIETRIPAVVISGPSGSFLYVNEQNSARVREGMKVRIRGSESGLQTSDPVGTQQKVTENISEYARHLGDFRVGEWIYGYRLTGSLQEGTYSADVIIEEISPVSFVIN
ncbi:MAG: hypothetical protein K6G22_12255 [Lachnospiraceae bacterium]|nr:hypothetical protein [Lachnospiraceae bacterium]